MKRISRLFMGLAILTMCVAGLWGGRVQAQGSGLAFNTPVSAALESTGFLVVVDRRRDSVVRVDPTTGDRTIVSSATIGTGPVLSDPLGIAVAASGALLVVDRTLDAVVRVDPTTGDRTIVSDAAMGTGPAFGEPRGIAVAASGALLVVDRTLNAVVRVDPTTGNRTIVSNATIGTGPVLSDPRGIAVEASGALLVVDQALDAVVRVDPTTGDRTVVSGCPETPDPCPVPVIGSGTPLLGPVSVAVRSDALVVVDRHPTAVVLVDPTTGDRVIRSDNTIGSGPILLNPVSIAGRTVVDTDQQALILVDLTTGDRRFISKAPALTISPPSGKYATLDSAELALIAEGFITEILQVTAVLDGIDVSTTINSCGAESQLPSGELVLRCPSVGELFELGPGGHAFGVQLLARVGDQGIQTFNRSVVWSILGTSAAGANE